MPSILKTIKMLNLFQVWKNRTTPWGSTLTLLMILVLNLNAQVNVRTALDTNFILIGDQLQMKVEVNASSQLKSVKAITEGIDTSGNIEFISETDWQNTGSGFRKIYTLTSFDSAYYNLLPLKVVYQTDYKTDTAYSNSLGFMVDNPKQDSTMADIKPIVAEPTKLEDFYPLLIGLGLVLLFGILGWYFFRKKEEVIEETPEIIRPAHTIAIEKLSLLKSEELWQKGEVKNYYSKLTFIFREYLENRFKIQALESTSDEILGQLQDQDFDPGMNDQVRRVLQSADLVKFAKAKPSEEFHAESFEKLEQFIETTKAPEQLTEE